jgi:gliding motility-associated-like protein
MIKHLYTFLLFFVLSLNNFAQVDTSFWFVAPDISATLGDSPINLHLQTYGQAATIYVRQPANAGGVAATLTIPANTITVFNLTGSIVAVENSPVNSVNSKGIYISSNQKISAYYSIGAANNKEMISLKGSRAKGNDFYIPVPNSLTTAATYTDGYVGVDVVATRPGITTLLITPRAACIGHAKNVTFAVSLNQGQTYSLRDNNGVNPSELAGTIVSSDSAVAVTVSGIVRTSPTTCASYYADQITTSGNLGKDYVILRGDGATDMAYILSTLNSTSLTITTGTNVTATLINFGETFSVNVTAPMSYIKTDKPVYVLHTSGYGCKLSGGQVTPAYCAGSYTSAFPRLSSDSLNLNIYTRSGFQNTFTLTSNGTPVPVPAANFTVVPGTGGALVAARMFFSTLSIAPGSHNILTNNQDLFGLGVINGSTPGGSSYAYTTEFGSNAFVIANALPTATICSNTSFTLNGQIGGGPITGFWSYNAFGTLSGPNTQLINNVYTPSPIDTNIKPVKIVLTSTGNCPNKSDTLKLTVKQAPIVNAGADQIICSNNASLQLTGNVLGPTNQGVWNVVAPGNGTFTPNVNVLNPIYNASNTDTMLPKLKFVLTSTNNAGCLAVTDTIVAFINKAPVVKSSTINPIVRCKNNPNVFLNGTISGTVTSTGSWTTSGTGYFSPNNLSLISNYVPSPADLAAGTVTLKLTSTNNQQCKPVSDSVVINFTQPPTLNVGPALNSCKNNPIVNLNAVIGGTATNTGIWYGGGGVFSPTNTALTPSYTGNNAEVNTGFVILTFSTTNNGLCTGVSSQVRIDFRDKPTANFIVNTVCLNQLSAFIDKSINTSGIGSLSGWQWNLGNGATTTSQNPVYTYTAPGTYTTQLVVNNSFGCYDTINKPVTVYALPTASMSVSRACSSSSLLVSFTDQSSISPPATIPLIGGYFWDFGGFGTTNAKDTAIIFPSQGIYNITHVVTSNNGCKSTISQSVNVTPVPKANFLFVNNSSLSLVTNISFIDSSRSAVTWNWDFGNTLLSNLQNPVTTYTANGNYTVTLNVTDQFGCSSTHTAVIRVSNVVSEISQLIPNIISPNNDGKNDIWRLDFINVFFPSAEIEIYNRWGDQIYHSIGYSNAWDGSYKGAPLPVGAYFYIIKLNDPKDTNIYKGTITLLK